MPAPHVDLLLGVCEKLEQMQKCPLSMVAHLLLADGNALQITRYWSPGDGTVRRRCGLARVGREPGCGGSGAQSPVVPRRGASQAATQSVLVPGASGSGKSTLAAGRARAGFAYLSDELVALELDGGPLASLRQANCREARAARTRSEQQVHPGPSRRGTTSWPVIG